MPESLVHNVDCLEYMKGLPDKAFELAIVDPPYGIGASSDLRFGTKANGAGSARTDYVKKEWDSSSPSPEYFNELRRVSCNQIIWGANYFGLIGGMLFWHKNQTDYSSSHGELAYLSMVSGVHYINILWHGAYQQDMVNKEKRIHPTQKPVALYKWLLKNYAKPGDRIFDSHMGSQSSRIAAYDMGFDFVGCELDKDYFDAGNKRFEQYKAQLKLF